MKNRMSINSNNAIGIINNGSMKLRNQDLIFYGVILKILFDYSYAVPLQSSFATNMFIYDVNYVKLAFSYIITFIQFYYLPNKDDSSSAFVVILLMYVILPINTMYALKDENSLFYLLISFLFVIFEYIVFKIKIKKVYRFNFSKQIEVFLYILTIYIYCQLFLIKGIPSFEAFNLFNIYDFRQKNPMNFNKYLYYLIVSQAYFVNQIFVAISYLRKNYIKLLMFLALQLLLFMWFGHKYMLFSSIVLLMACYVSKFEQKQKKIVRLFFLFILLTIIVKFIFNINRIVNMYFSLFVSRALFMPAALKFNYYEFFSINENIGLWGTILAPLLNAAGFKPFYHPDPVTKVIGAIYAGGSNANTGLWGAEIMHFGLIGVFVSFFCLLAFVYVIKISERRNGTRFTFIVAFTSVLNLNESGISQMFTISPLLFTLIFLSIYSFKYKHQKNNEKCYSCKICSFD